MPSSFCVPELRASGTPETVYSEGSAPSGSPAAICSAEISKSGLPDENTRSVGASFTSVTPIESDSSYVSPSASVTRTVTACEPAAS